jgi:hypothetical protein
VPSPPYKILSKSTNHFHSCTHLRSLNVRHFGVVEAMALKVWSRGHLQCHHLLTRFHPNLPIGSEVIKEFLCIHLRSLNARHFGMAEATRLKNVASRSSSMESPAYQISWKSADWFKVISIILYLTFCKTNICLWTRFVMLVCTLNNKLYSESHFVCL